MVSTIRGTSLNIKIRNLPFKFIMVSHVELSLTLLRIFMFLVLFSIVITSLMEERAALYASRAFACLACMRYILSFFSSLLCQCLAAAHDCDTSWDFHLTYRKIGIEYTFAQICVLDYTCNSQQTRPL